MEAHVLKLNKVPLFSKNPMNINVSMSANVLLNVLQ